MKKKHFIIALVLISVQGYAQLNKNKFMLSGRGNYYTNRSNQNNDAATSLRAENKDSRGALQLNIGYTFSNNIAVGIIGGFEKNKESSTNFYTNNYFETKEVIRQSYNTGVFARYTRMISESKFGFFFELDNTYIWGRDNFRSIYFPNPTNTDNYAVKMHGFKSELIPGLVYFISNKLSIEATFGNISYATTVYNWPLKHDRNDAQFNVNFSTSTFFLGLTFYFGKSEDSTSTKNLQ